MAASVKRKKYVKYGDNFGNVRKQALDVLSRFMAEELSEFNNNTLRRTPLERSEQLYLSMGVIKYMYKTIRETKANFLCYDTVFVLTRPSIARKIVNTAIEEIKHRGLFTSEFTRLNDLVDKIKFEITREYFRRNYKAYKVETMDGSDKLSIRYRDPSVTPSQFTDALARDGIIKYIKVDRDCYEVVSPVNKGARG